ncbi:hypothetical protein RHSIM_Rhsim13G0155000 [Rhododendron simsii]|uniref:PGG domain-containing protein n=1 Tax=Rhododendron simsii TaxID=118357 RepID=A0A834FZF2_RHOSS|nr:hypothetical protein RHSIM_Rhsim13G0155000 [Rhododendron simsii]
MGSLIKFQRTLSIQSCFPETGSTPGSGQRTPPNDNIHTTRICETPVDEGMGVETMFSIEIPMTNSAQVLPLPPSGQHVSLLVTDRVSTAIAFRPTSTSQLTLPRRFLRVRTKANINRTVYVPLYQAALTGDWEKANEFIRVHPSSLTARITKGRETALHIAAGAKQANFVEELVKLMNARDLELKNKFDNTALCFAAASGNTRIAEVMVKKNSDLPSMRGSKGVTALHMAALLGHKDMVWFLYSVTKDEDLTKEDFIGLLIASISSNLFDVALHILDRQPQMAIERDSNGETALHVLARKTLAFSCKSGLGIGQGFSNSSTYMLFRSRLLWIAEEVLCIKGFQSKKILDMQPLELLKRLWEQITWLDDAQIGSLLRSPSQPTFIAVEFGNFEFVFELLRSYPDLIWKVDDQSRSIFHIAVMHRQEKIFNLIYDIGAHKDLITAYKDTNNTNMLHLAAKLGPANRLNIVSGAALQMQRELLWFKEVEKNVQPSYKDMRDTNGRTPRMLFTEEHKGLVNAGERWMKDTATSCMLVAALITTVMFAAIFTVPGGNNDEGTPNFIHTKPFVVFTVTDAFALFSSVTSILMFLSILTSRYAEEDFLETLPKRLIIGLTTLFLSIASMLIAFTATFVMVLSHKLTWFVIPVALTACVPVTLFAFLQFPLLADTIHSSYGSGIFARRDIDKLY